MVLLARLPVPVLPLHRDGHVVHVNRAFEDMLGYPHDALSGRSIHDPVPTVSPPRPAAEDLRHSAGKVVTLTHRGGSTVRAAISKSVLEWEEDPVLIVQLCNQINRRLPRRPSPVPRQELLRTAPRMLRARIAGLTTNVYAAEFLHPSR